jgi:probable rRNA maturation factor
MSPPRLELELDVSVEDGLDLSAWDEARMADLVRGIIGRELGPGDYTLGVHLVGDATIRALNAEHRGQDVHTDVLSFPLHATPDAQQMPFVLPPSEPVSLGDVVVSVPRAAEQAQAFGHSTARELAYLVAHGVLHILGYDHEAPDERQQMRQREEEALVPLGFTR